MCPLQRECMERGVCGEMVLGLCCLGSLWMENLSLPKGVSGELHVMTSWR